MGTALPSRVCCQLLLSTTFNGKFSYAWQAEGNRSWGPPATPTVAEMTVHGWEMGTSPRPLQPLLSSALSLGSQQKGWVGHKGWGLCQQTADPTSDCGLVLSESLPLSLSFPVRWESHHLLFTVSQDVPLVLLVFPSPGRNTQAPGDAVSLPGRRPNSSSSRLRGTREEGQHVGQVILGHRTQNRLSRQSQTDKGPL